MITGVYVDAFNLYFGALRGTPYKWLDLSTLCRHMLPKNEIKAIKYYTALVTPRAKDPDQPVRQQTYLRALKTLPNLSIHHGHFLTHIVKMPLASSIAGETKYAEVIKTEEKGSDVNLATHLLYDAFRGEFEVAVVISNDSDLVEPIRIVTRELKKSVGVLNPHEHPSRVLHAHATFFKKIRRGVLKASQFPETLTDKHGTFHKPEGW